MEKEFTSEELLGEISRSLKAVASKQGQKPMSVAEQKQLFKSIAGVTDEAKKARTAYAESRAAYLLELIPMQSTVRKIFKVEDLGVDAQPEYPISFDYTNLASFMPKFGGNVVRVVEGDILYVPTFGIEGAVRYSMDIAEQGRLDLGALSLSQLRDQIVLREEQAGWATIKGSFSGVNSNQTVYCSGTTENFHNFTKKAVNKMLTQMDINRRALTDIYASPRSIHDVKEWSNNQIDFTTQREMFLNGGLPGTQQFGVDGGRIWDINLTKVYNSNLVSDSEAWGFDGQKYGVMPIRKGLMTYEDPVAILQWQVGIMARELVGFGTLDSWSAVKASLDASHLGSACSTF